MKNFFEELKIVENEIQAICSGIKTVTAAVGNLNGDDRFSGCDAEILLNELRLRLELTVENLEKIEKSVK